MTFGMSWPDAPGAMAPKARGCLGLNAGSGFGLARTGRVVIFRKAHLLAGSR